MIFRPEGKPYCDLQNILSSSPIISGLVPSGEAIKEQRVPLYAPEATLIPDDQWIWQRRWSPVEFNCANGLTSGGEVTTAQRERVTLSSEGVTPGDPFAR
ncbi:hypothetical protein SKAU_G00177020 [Synaphobranchus kaupii]|uniref:Uncharacterized protein n=1 Tax=Synaphobranchus kaupii TaxID=118154 RepID=A0A9Q1FLG6_SYNKA|nr:hypothetical protein SKAU_G00177020 [Synaphobranchus kaupii]